MKTCFLILGRSASGKDSVVKELNKLGYKSVLSYATRPRRDGEGDTHIFIPPSEVDDFKKDILAYTKIGTVEYFATKQQLLESNIYIIDYEGTKELRKRIKPEDNIRFVVIYIYATPEECYERAINRRDKIQVYEKRVSDEHNQFEELELELDFDYFVHNVNLKKTVEVVKRIMEVENI